MSDSRFQRAGLNTDFYMQGQRDCKEGNPCKQGMHGDYYRGFSDQFTIEAINDHRCDLQEIKIYGKLENYKNDDL